MEAINQDTPQQNANPNDINGAFDTVQRFGAEINEGSNEGNLSVEDAFSKVEAENTTTQAPTEDTPAPVEETTTQDQPYEAKNDERRFEYWQSQAAKRENEMREMKAELEKAKTAPPTQPQEQAETVQEFPPPPAVPRKPAGFSREEAYSDARSESARYLDEKDQWETDMREYSELKHQYDLAVMQEKLDKQNQMITNQQKKREAQIQQGRKINEIKEHVIGHYGLNVDEATEFVSTMSDPKSISMDNLVQLYRMNKAGGQQPPVNTGPSEAFQQSKNAQQIPTPMGVMPSQPTEDVRDDSNKIMDELIGNFNSKNP